MKNQESADDISSLSSERNEAKGIMNNEADLELCSLLLALDKGNSTRGEARRRFSEYLQAGETEALQGFFRAVGRKARLEAKKELKEAQHRGFSLISIAHPSYPQRLRGIAQAPALLYIAGTLPERLWRADAAFVVGIVGTRRATPYGLRIARRLAQEVTCRGGLVVSGLAYGIDTAAHEGALAGAQELAELRPEIPRSAGAAVLGTGLLHLHPARNRPLAADLCAAGGVLLSDYGLYEHGSKFTFPERNRIISGLSDAVIIVEARERSGALITARLALEQGRSVFSIPGPIDVPQSVGPNRLLRNGAHVLLSLEDLFEQLPYLRDRQLSSVEPSEKACGKEAEGSWERMFVDFGLQAAKARALCKFVQAQGAVDFDQLVRESCAEPHELRTLLSSLELAGVLCCSAAGEYSLA